MFKLVLWVFDEEKSYWHHDQLDMIYIELSMCHMHEDRGWKIFFDVIYSMP